MTDHIDIEDELNHGLGKLAVLLDGLKGERREKAFALATAAVTILLAAIRVGHVTSMMEVLRDFATAALRQLEEEFGELS